MQGRTSVALEGAAAGDEADWLFSTERNPLMTTQLFLSEVIGTRVSAAAASAAMSELVNPGVVLHDEGAFESVADGAAVAAHAETQKNGASNGATLMQADAAPSTAEDQNGNPAAAPADAAGAANGNAVDREADDGPELTAPVMREQQRHACAAALLGAATKAKFLADKEMQTMQNAASEAMLTMLTKQRAKLAYWDSITTEIGAAQGRIAEAKRQRLQAPAEVQKLRETAKSRQAELDKLTKEAKALGVDLPKPPAPAPQPVPAAIRPAPSTQLARPPGAATAAAAPRTGAGVPGAVRPAAGAAYAPQRPAGVPGVARPATGAAGAAQRPAGAAPAIGAAAQQQAPGKRPVGRPPTVRHATGAAPGAASRPPMHSGLGGVGRPPAARPHVLQQQQQQQQHAARPAAAQGTAQPAAPTNGVVQGGAARPLAEQQQQQQQQQQGAPPQQQQQQQDAVKPAPKFTFS